MLSFFFICFFYLVIALLFIFVMYIFFWVWEFGMTNSGIPNSVTDLNFGLYYLLQAYSHTNFLFEYLNFLKIIHEKEFFIMWAYVIWKLFYQEIFEQSKPGTAFWEYLEAQILKIYSVIANHGGTFMGSMCVLVCPKRPWIHHWL